MRKSVASVATSFIPKLSPPAPASAYTYRIKIIRRFIFLAISFLFVAYILRRDWEAYSKIFNLLRKFAHGSPQDYNQSHTGLNDQFGRAGETSMERALKLLERAPVLDTHNDLAYKIELLTEGGNISSLDLYNLPLNLYQTDITRLKQGRVGSLFFSAYVDCHDYHLLSDNIRDTLDQIDLVKRIIRKYPEVFQFATSVSDIKSITATGKIASLIGLEGGHHIDSSMGVLRMYYELGVRYMTLTHACPTSWADSCFPPFLYNGISENGLRFIREMNRLGMLVDISHVSPESMASAILNSLAPVIFSHSSIYTKTPHPRNVPDHILHLLPTHDGVVMINFEQEYVRANTDVYGKTGIERVVEHMCWVKNEIGARFLGIGADFDGDIVPAVGLEDVSKYPSLIAKLIEAGFTDDEIMGVTGGNLLRVFEKAEQVSKEMQAAGAAPDEDGIDVAKKCILPSDDGLILSNSLTRGKRFQKRQKKGGVGK